MFDYLMGVACHADDAIAIQLGWSKTTYALVTFYVTGALAGGFLAAWFLTFGTLRRAGFSRVLQRMVWWFVLVVALFQMALTLLRGIDIEPIPCPWPSIWLLGITALFIATAYGFHVQNKNKGSGFKFLQLIALPALGEVTATARYTVSGALKGILWVMHLSA